MANNSISLVNLDFDALKQNLKTYLQSQPQFADYNFDGSNMSVLLDILSYNTYQNAFYLNMVASEMFLDSAQLRNSVISKAKELNYTPRSTKSATALINCQFAQSGLSTFTIPYNTSFTGQSSNGTYTFTTSETSVLYPSGGYFTAANLQIHEGAYFVDSFIVDTTIERQRFMLYNNGVDTDSLVVTVYENNGNTVSQFQQASSLFGLQSNSNIYFVQAAEDTRYEICFGDGTFGRYPLNSAIVTAQYRVSVGSDGNGTTNFSLNDNLGMTNGLGSAVIPTIQTAQPAYGGANAESIESIRYRASRAYQTQDRAVTQDDYQTIVLQNYPDIKACHVYGGDQVQDSVQYGKVFIVPATYSGSPLSSSEKQSITAFLTSRCTVGIKPTVIDPDYLYLQPTSTVFYDSSNTALTGSDIQSVASTAVQLFNTSYLIDFDTVFKLSRLEAAINAADPSITSNETSITMRKDISAQLGKDNYLTVYYNNAIVPGSISSTMFSSGSKIYMYTDYNVNNNTFQVQQVVGGKVQITNTSTAIYLVDVTNAQYPLYTVAGTVSYDTGTITMNKIQVTGYVNSEVISFYAQPLNHDIKAFNNDLVLIDMQSLVLGAQPN